MKIIGLKVDGIRKLTAVEMQLKDKGLIPIKGKNKQGKSTLIDTVEWLIEGNKVANPQLVQNGKEKAEAELTLGDYKIKRTLAKNPKLEVRNTLTGALEKGEVQNFLNTFINELTFNPRPFKDKTSVEKFRFCLDLFREKLEVKSKAALGYDFAGIDTKLSSLEEDRKLVGREVKQFGDLDLNAPAKTSKVDISKILAKKADIEKQNTIKRVDFDKAKQKEIEEINDFNREQREKKSVIDDLKKSINDNLDKMQSMTTEIQELELKLTQLKSGLEIRREYSEKTVKELDLLPQPEPEKPLVSTIPQPEYLSTSEEDSLIQWAIGTNEKAGIYEAWLNKKTEKAAKESIYSDYTQQIQTLRNKKLEILRSIDTGVKGLEIREDGIYYNDVYSENWSDSENLRISAELCLSQMPELRAVFIDGAESFDSDSLKDLETWAIENDVQCIVTIVSDIPEQLENGVFYITEGRVITSEEE